MDKEALLRKAVTENLEREISRVPAEQQLSRLHVFSRDFVKNMNKLTEKRARRWTRRHTGLLAAAVLCLFLIVRVMPEYSGSSTSDFDSADDAGWDEDMVSESADEPEMSGSGTIDENDVAEAAPESDPQSPVLAEYLLWRGTVTEVREDGFTYEVTWVDGSYEAAMDGYGTVSGDLCEWSFESSILIEDEEGGELDITQVEAGMTVAVYNNGMVEETYPLGYPISKIVVY